MFVCSALGDLSENAMLSPVRLAPGWFTYLAVFMDGSFKTSHLILVSHSLRLLALVKFESLRGLDHSFYQNPPPSLPEFLFALKIESPELLCLVERALDLASRHT